MVSKFEMLPPNAIPSKATQSQRGAVSEQNEERDMDMSPPPKYSGDDYTADELPPKMSTRGTRRGPMSTQKKIAYS